MVYTFFLFISMGLYAAGFVYLTVSGVYSFDDPRVWLHFQAYSSFTCAFALGGLFLKILVPQRAPPQFSLQLDLAVGRRVNQLANWIGVIACGFVILYIFDTGFQKILSLGSAIDGLSFRFIGLSDRSFYISAPMELSRRLLLPFVLLVKLTILRLGVPIARWPLYFLSGIFLAISVINLDRGPVLLFILLFSFHLYSSTRSVSMKFVYIAFSAPLLGISGALFTFLQYNNLDFTWSDIVETVDGILVNRIILSPVRMAQGWVFDNATAFSEPLALAYSRVSVLWGGGYVGSHSDFAYFVAPVGVIGDSFRNLGYGGMVIFGAALGFAFMLVERGIKTTSPIVRTPFNFIALILAMYIYYGNVFSLGPFAILLFLAFGPYLIKLIRPSRVNA